MNVLFMRTTVLRMLPALILWVERAVLSVSATLGTLEMALTATVNQLLQ